MDLPIRPKAGDYIVERDARPTERKVGSIIIAESNERLLSSGKISAGNGLWQEGDHVYFSPYAGFTVRVNGRDLIQMAEHEILGRFVEDAEVYVA